MAFSDAFSGVLDVQFNEDTREYFVELPTDLCKELDWGDGTVIQWVDNLNGTVTLVRKNGKD